MADRTRNAWRCWGPRFARGAKGSPNKPWSGTPASAVDGRSGRDDGPRIAPIPMQWCNFRLGVAHAGKIALGARPVYAAHLLECRVLCLALASLSPAFLGLSDGGLSRAAVCCGAAGHAGAKPNAAESD